MQLELSRCVAAEVGHVSPLRKNVNLYRKKYMIFGTVRAVKLF